MAWQSDPYQLLFLSYVVAELPYKKMDELLAVMARINETLSRRYGPAVRCGAVGSAVRCGTHHTPSCMRAGPWVVGGPAWCTAARGGLPRMYTACCVCCVHGTGFF